MLKKKFIMLAILLVGLLAVSAVSAADNASSDIVSADETADEAVTANLDENELEASPGTFTDLANAIANANSDLNLKKNYYYNNETDSDYKDGITIDKIIEINGNGHTIDGKDQARIFNVTAPSVVINNIKFVNAYSNDYGGAISWDYDAIDGALYDCSFVNCFASTESLYSGADGGAVYWRASGGTLSGCSFKDCYSNRGGAVAWAGYMGSLKDSNFVNCSALSQGGGIRWSASSGVLANCSFVNCTTHNGGGAVYFYYVYNGTITDCSFVNSSSGDGGAVSWYEGDNGAITNCDFVNSYATSIRGGAIDWNSDEGLIANCSFMNSTSGGHGGAICLTGEDCVVANCSFVNSLAQTYYGGAVKWASYSSNNGVLINCSFENSIARKGGAIYWGCNNGTVAESIFTKSYGEEGKGIYFEGSDCSLMFSTFDDVSDWYSEQPLIVIDKFSTVLSAPSVSTSYGVSKNLVVTLKDVNGNLLAGEKISIILNNVEYTLKTNSKGKASLAIPTNLAPKTYTAAVSYGGSRKYDPSSVTTKVIVKKMDTPISAVYDGREIVATLTNINGKAISGANLQVNLNGATTTMKTNSKGQITISTADLPLGTYTATFSYNGNSKYNPSSTSLDFTVKINIILDAYYDENNNKIVVTLTNEDTGKAVSGANVQVNLNGATTTAKTNSKGQVTVSTADLPLGTYTATFSYAGNSKYNPASTSLDIDLRIKVIITDIYGDSDKLVATLTNGATGKPITNANMQVEINGVTKTVKSNSKGVITLDTSDLGVTAYTATISYAGNSKYTPSSATAAIDLNKANMIITYEYNQDKHELVATLKNSKTGKVVSSANMVVDINGIQTTLKSNSQGRITFSTADFAPGTYVGTISYGGNSKYNQISAAFKADV